MIDVGIGTRLEALRFLRLRAKWNETFDFTRKFRLIFEGCKATVIAFVFFLFPGGPVLGRIGRPGWAQLLVGVDWGH